MDEQITLFDETPENTSQNPFECPFANDGQHHWWSSRNTHLCHSAVDCSHCYITNVMALRQKNKLRQRKSVFYCKHVVKDEEAEVQWNEFAHKCEITGNKWKTTAWNYREDYDTNPINYPCKFCDLPSCDKCIFHKEVSDQNPYGCCGSCAHRLFCRDSKHKDLGTVTAESFVTMEKAKLSEEPKYPETDLSKGACKKTYHSDCPHYLGYMYGGPNETYIKCACTEEKLKTEVFTAICHLTPDVCPLYKEAKEKTNG